MFNYIDFKTMFEPDDIIVYLRKSRSDDPTLTVDEVLQKHEAMLDEWAERNLGAKIPEQNKFREVVSGETIADRPEVQRVLKLIESPRYKAILIVEVQRLSRGDLEDAGRLIKLLRYTDTYVITPPKTYDLKDEYDRETFERELKRGNEFLEYTKKIMNNGRLLSVSQGNFIGNKPPYGYDKVFVTEGKRKCPVLTPNKEQAEVVKKMFDMYVRQDMPCAKICKEFDEMGIKPPQGKHWSPASMAKMIENVHYIGKVRWNHRKTVTIVEDGEIKQTRPVAKEGEYQIYDGKHQAIISEEIFNAAQAKKGKNIPIRKNQELRNPLAGLIWCHCGRAMSLRIYKNADGTERNAPRLLCDDQVHCKTGSCLYEEMIDKVAEILSESIKDFEVQLKNETEDSSKFYANLIKDLEKRLKDIQAKELAQWEQQSHPDPAQRMPPEIFKQLNEKLKKEKDEVQQALRHAKESTPSPIDYEARISKFKAALSALRDPEIDATTKNRLLKACIERIDYNRERPERIKSTAKRITVNGRRIKPNGLPVGGNWTKCPIELNVKLNV